LAKKNQAELDYDDAGSGRNERNQRYVLNDLEQLGVITITHRAAHKGDYNVFTINADFFLRREPRSLSTTTPVPLDRQNDNPGPSRQAERQPRSLSTGRTTTPVPLDSEPRSLPTQEAVERDRTRSNRRRKKRRNHTEAAADAAVARDTTEAALSSLDSKWLDQAIAVIDLQSRKAKKIIEAWKAHGHHFDHKTLIQNAPALFLNNHQKSV